MVKKSYFLLISITLVILIGAVGVFIFYPYNPKKPPRVDDSGKTKEGVEMVREANNKFTLSLYRELTGSKEENIFFSPYSIFSAMAMTYEGAEGKTKEEIKSLFNFPEKEVLRPNFASIYNSLNESKGYVLRIGNALWIQKEFKILDDYKKRIERYYGGRAENLDFIREREKSREIINSFIEKQTEGKIKNLIPKGIINDLTRLIITNAIYFNGTWKVKFDKGKTKDMDFYITPKRSIKVPMMYMKPEKEEFNYAETEELQILELPYKGNRVSMFVILPKEGVMLKDVEKKLTYPYLKGLLNKMEKTKLEEIYLPKFKFERKYILKDIFMDMGMRNPFSFDADFSGIDGKKDLLIQNIVHQAFIDVNEKGTEAAGATAVIIGLKSLPPGIVFKADHPFVFFIQDKETGVILFMGRVVNPLS